jgi:aspartyl-tRNA(Asn)/glutamyl-tRNA(Gln) amidotransferase subunit A
MSNFKIWPSIQEIASSVASGNVTAVENVEEALQQIEKHSDYNAIVSVVKERAVQRAKEIDALIADGKEVGRLAGVPFIAKDNFLSLGSETTASSGMLKGFTAPYQATVIERLEDEGAICVAKANLDAFAHGSSTENSDFFVTKNPHDKSRVPGGSSGDSAAAVALGLAPFALGTDTGGSIRLPASYCGVVGYKPTYGLVSRSGVVAMASSTDVIGPLTRTVEDSALVLDVMAGKDELDSTTIDRDEKSYSNLESVVKGKKVGVIAEYFDGLDSEIEKSITSTIKALKSLGAEVEDVSMPSLSLSLAVYYVLVPAELSSNLSRYDGQRYQYSASDFTTLDESYVKSRTEGFGDEAKRRIMIGTHVLSSGYYDAYYKKAQTVRTKIINEFEDAFSKFDFLVGPTAPNVAFKIGENVNDPLSMYLVDIMTVSANLAGVPSISIPAAQVDELPVGFQIMTRQNGDLELLSAAKEIQEATNA